jgi:dTDP-4-dehydrorhamnose reductase
VAGSVVAQTPGNWQIAAVARSAVTGGPSTVEHHQLDLCDCDATARLFAEVRPDAVIHTAAIADIDYCQSHRDEAERINVGVTEQLAELCEGSGARLVFCSTDAVFDGKRGNYSEDHEPVAVNFYADTKIRGEQAVVSRGRGMVAARLALVMGLPIVGAGNSFLARMIASLDAGKSVAFPQNEIRTPVDVVTLGRALLELAAGDYDGLLHLAGSTRLDRYEIGQRIARRLGYDLSLIEATHSNKMAGRAPRADDASLDNTRARDVLNTPMLELDEALELVLATKEKFT